MAQIRSFEAPALGLNPSETGVTAKAQAGRFIGRFYNEASSATMQAGALIAGGMKDLGDEAVRYAEHREISHGSASFAELNDTLTQQWNDTAKTADPNDPTVAAKFREEVLEPALDQYRKGFLTEGGQRFAEQRIESLRSHMFTKTAADMSSLAADAVSVNMRQTANSLSNTAMNDPSSVDHLLQSTDAMVAGIVDSSPNLKGAAASKATMELSQKMKEAIVKSAAVGAIQKADNPEAEAEKWGKKYPEFISGDELKLLAGNARAQIRSRRIDDAYLRHNGKQQEQDVSDDRVTNFYLPKIHSDDPQERAKVSTNAVVNDPILTRKDKEHLISVVEREMKPETAARISAATSANIMRQMHDPDADPKKISDMIFAARIKDPGMPGSLTKSDFADLQKQLIDQKTPEGQALKSDRDEFFKRYGPTIDGAVAETGVHSTLGLQKMYLAEKDALRMEDQLRKAGKDPHGLYDPSSPDFFGKPSNLMKYHVSMQDDINYRKQVEAPGGGNLTGKDKQITGIQVTDVPFRPPANWQFSASRQQFRDPDGNLYDINGKRVK